MQAAPLAFSNCSTMDMIFLSHIFCILYFFCTIGFVIKIYSSVGSEWGAMGITPSAEISWVYCALVMEWDGGVCTTYAMSPQPATLFTHLIHNHLFCIALRSVQKCDSTWPRSRATPNSALPPPAQGFSFASLYYLGPEQPAHLWGPRFCIDPRAQDHMEEDGKHICLQPDKSIVSTLDGSKLVFLTRDEIIIMNDMEGLENGVGWWNENQEMREPRENPYSFYHRYYFAGSGI